MSNDNIDYAELDKAVNEAMHAQPARPAARTTARKTTAKAAPVANHVVARPQNRGHIMDFAPRGAIRRPTPTQPTRTTVAQTARPVTPQRPATSNIAQRSAIKPASRIATVRKATTTARPVAPKALTETPKMTAPRPSVAAKIQQKRQRVEDTTPPKALKPKAEAPDANSYSLGGRSPFLTDTKVEKRPLGNNIPETNATTVHSTKNVYSTKNPSKAPATKRKKHTVTEAPKSHSGWLWTLIVILVIAAGAGLGYLAYLIVFAN